ncbi:piggyBac transposable element-derived protein 4-like [Lingula anatina]|uniref:PiggyBac transposable element-derived protein 4-like n=1 Tax=Lingula anatina TaxID=7574 RepID=A0A1S3KFI3_LINAN|nr:piggyBac transposable element-derived protein 4-like [Lingula anatina]|eukprot:XP_013420996.1 piggyBac transposable element-derived protein 4-like [Lingula anatina]
MAEFLPEHQDFFNKLINDDKSDDEFEGFLPSDIANDGSNRESDILMNQSKLKLVIFGKTEINLVFGSVYMPNRHLSLDEGMVPWRGHLAFRVYNPDKPKKYGIKAYMICDGETGYCTKFKLYTGKSNTPVSQHGATYDLVMDMMRGYFGQGYILYMDNYYSSPKLYKDLFSLGCGATGTLRANRKGVPQKILNTKVSKGEQFTMNNGTLLITVPNTGHDRKVVHLISTIEQAEMTPTGRNIPGTNTPIVVPSIVREYNRFMGGVDRSDQMVSYSTFNARTLKWWKRVTFHVISLAVLNAYLLYKTVTTGNPMLHRVFRKRLVADLINSVQGHVVPSKSVGRPSTSDDSLFRLMGQHFPIKITATSCWGKKEENWKRIQL